MAQSRSRTRNVVVVDNRALALKIGTRIRQARLRAGQTQSELAKGRYTAAYISALERGHAKPSMAALAFIAERLGIPIRDVVGADDGAPGRLEADLLLASGDYVGALDRYESLLERASDRRRRAEVLRGIAESLCRLDRGERAIASAAEAAELFRALHRPADAADATYWLAYAHFQQDNIAEARVLLSELLVQTRSGVQPVPDFRFRLLVAMGSSLQREGEFERAITYMEEARGLSGDLDLRRRASLLGALSLSYREAGDYEASVMAGTQSLALYRAANAEREEAALSSNLAMTYLRVGNLDRADALLASAGAALEGLDDLRLLANNVESQAQLALAHGDLPGAEALLDRARELAEETANYQAQVGISETSSRLAQARNDPDGAVHSLEVAVALLREHGPRARLQADLGQLAELHRQRGDLQAATHLYAEALNIRR
jgi:transcriptional regulator with XRE-family HTH domain